MDGFYRSMSCFCARKCLFGVGHNWQLILIPILWVKYLQTPIFGACMGIRVPSQQLFCYWALVIQVRTHVDPVTHCVIPYSPHGRFVHVAPPYPSSDWANDFGAPWWRDGSYIIGNLSKKTRLVKVVNTLTSQEHVIEVSCATLLSSAQWPERRIYKCGTRSLLYFSVTFCYLSTHF